MFPFNIPNFGNIIDKMSVDSTTVITPGLNNLITEYKTSTSFGHINNKKGISVTSDPTVGNFVYALTTINNATGIQLIIRTFTGTTGNLVEKNLLIPEIPYRIFLNDPNFFNNILTPVILSNKDAFDIFNPDIASTYDLSTRKYTIHSEFNNGSTSMVQINLPRSVISSISQNIEYHAYKILGYDLLIRSIFKVYDLQASIIVKKDSTDPDLYDWIYLTVCSRVDINCLLKSDTWNSNYWMYSLPVTLKFKITKANLVNSIPQILVPYSWTYPLSNEWTKENPNVSIGKITSWITGAYPTNQWNYNLIPSKIRNGNFYEPKSFGCLADMSFKSDTELLIYSSVGNSIVGKENYGSSYKQINSLCKVDLSSAGFQVPTINPNALNIESEDEICGQLTIESVSGSWVSVVHDSYTKDSNFVHLSFYDSSDLSIKSSVVFEGGIRSDLTMQNSGLYLKYDTLPGEKTIIYKFPVINNTFLSNLGFTLKNNYSIETYLDNIGMVKKMKTSVFPFHRNFQSYAFNDLNKTFYIDTLNQDKSFMKDLTNYNNSDCLYLTFTSSTNLILNCIRFHPDQDVAYKTRYIDSDIDADMGSWILNTMFVTQEDGFDPDEYCMVKLKTISPLTINNISIFSPNKLTLGNTSNFEYWSNPTLGINYNSDQETQLNDEKRVAINLIVNISGCSGIYSSINPLTVNSYVDSLVPKINDDHVGGIPIDSYTRSDMSFKYAGDHSIYENNFTTSQIGYWAEHDGVATIQFKGPLNNSLLFGSVNKIDVKPSIWHYNESGFFNIHLPLSLDLSNAGGIYPYTNPNFILSGCTLKVDFKDSCNKILDSKTYNSLTIDPPNGSGGIYSDGNITKTINNEINFILSKNSTKGDPGYTEILNTTSVIRSIWKHDNKFSQPFNYKDDSISYLEIPFLITQLDRGDYVYYQYEPKLNGTKSIIDGIAHTEIVTNCLGHKYSINKDTTQIKIGFGGSYSDNIIDEIKNQNPYIYVDTINTTCQTKVIVDINHEDWKTGDSSLRNSNTDSSIYPLISGVYLLAIDTDIDNRTNFNLSYLSKFKTSFKAYDSVTTYPNVYKQSDIIKNLINVSSPGVYATGIFMTPTYPSLSNQEISVEIKRSGRYRLYLEVEDEFGQCSTWCITNKNNNFYYPFEEV